MSRKRKIIDVRDEASRLAAEALAMLATLMRDSSSDQVKVAAARELLDRAHGKPRAEAAAGDGQTFGDLVTQADKGDAGIGDAGLGNAGLGNADKGNQGESAC